MIYTEDEAKTKQCRAVGPAIEMAIHAPQRTAAPVGGAFSVGYRPPLCVGSSCMLWETTQVVFEDHVIDPDRPVIRPDGDGWRLRSPAPGVVVWGRPTGVAGYCGLLKK